MRVARERAVRKGIEGLRDGWNIGRAGGVGCSSGYLECLFLFGVKRGRLLLL